VVDEAVVAKPIMESVKIDVPAAASRASSTTEADSEPEPEPTALEKKRMRAWALLSDWPEDRERTPKILAAAIASSEPMAARFIAQYDAEHGLVTSQN
jgi:hypothetical protein